LLISGAVLYSGYYGVSPDKLVPELVDLSEVIDVLMALHGVNEFEVREVQRERREQHGGFAGRIKLLWTSDGRVCRTNSVTVAGVARNGSLDSVAFRTVLR
jgi:hypothetical protein